MEGAQGAVLRVKLRYLDAWTDARCRHAAHYEELLADANVQTPKELPYARHVFHVYALRLAERDRLQLALQEKEIQTAIHYPIPVHLQKAYRDFGYGVGDLPVTEQVADELLSVPMFPEMKDSQIDQVCNVVRERMQ